MRRTNKNIKNNDALKVGGPQGFRAYNARRCINAGQVLPDNKGCLATMFASPLEGEDVCRTKEGVWNKLGCITPLPAFGHPLPQGARMTTRAFTLIELLVVVLIIGILAAVALPQYQIAVKKSRFAEYNMVAHSLAKATEMFYLANGTYPEYWNQLNVELPCEGKTTQLGDLICPNFYIDLNAHEFILRDEPNSPNRTRQAVDLSISYRFRHGSNGYTAAKGKYECNGKTSLGRKICTQLCGSNECLYN